MVIQRVQCNSALATECFAGHPALLVLKYQPLRLDAAPTSALQLPARFPHASSSTQPAARQQNVLARTDTTYRLFSDAAYTVNWGNTVGVDTVAMVGNGLGQPNTAYGEIPAGQYFAPGIYTDTITVTVTY